MSGAIARALAVLLVILAAVPAAAAEPTGPAIVLRLPSSISADQVRGMLVELESKGAGVQPAAITMPAEPVARRIVDRLRMALPKAPQLFDLPARWREAVAQGGRAATPFWPLLFAVVFCSLALERVARRLCRRRGVATGLPVAFARHLISLTAGTAAFVLAAKLGAGLLPTEPPLLREVADQVTGSAIVWRVAVALLALFVAPADPSARPLHLDDAGARRVACWIGIYLVYALLFVPTVWLVGRLGDADLALDAAFGPSLFILVYRVAMAFDLRTVVAQAILSADGTTPGTLRRWIARLWHWFYILFALVVMAFTLEQYVATNNVAVGRAASALQTVIIGMALAWAAKHRFIADYQAARPGAWWHEVVNHSVDMVVLIGGLVWLATLWGFDLFDPEAPGIAQTVLRPLFRAGVTLAIAWAVWSAIDGFLRERSPQQALGPIEEGGIDTNMTRLATLLPLLRNVFAIAIFFLGSVLALGDLGVDIGPLLAGAGVVGIALGFGAQALVRDVIAGLFFLIDDAFRLGEYIDTGHLKGTVEAISIRSVRLRHQNGQIHTIPFGQIQAVTNSSRDWAIIKFNLHIAPGIDLELVRKTLKQLGETLLEDPEIGGEFIQPLKMQGVVDVTQAAIMICCKFTARPVRPSLLRRRAMQGIIERFAVAGILFATPPTAASNPI